MDPTQHRKPINASEAAEYLGISVSTLSKRRVFGGGPKYLKLGRRFAALAVMDPAALAVAGGDRLPPLPIRAVGAP
jgi:hypothetical protein